MKKIAAAVALFRRGILASSLKSTSVFVSAIFLFSSISAPLAEANFWTERQAAKNKSIELAAALPSNLPALENLPRVTHTIPSLQQLPKSLEQNLPAAWRNPLSQVVAALPHALGTVRKITVPPTAGQQAPATIVVHIQDVHQNQEAQQNIAQAVKSLIDAGKVDVVAIEGHSGAIDLSGFQKFADRHAVQLAADYLLRENKISGPIQAGMTTQNTAPAFVGVDDPAHYRANVAAYLAASKNLTHDQAQWKRNRDAMETEKAAVFNAALMDLDRKVQDYRKNIIGLGEYVRTIAGATDRSAVSGTVKTFLAALDMENRLDFNQAEKDRQAVIAELAKKLDGAHTEQLLNRTVAYRLGNVTNGEFYGFLTSLCKKEGIDLAKRAAFQDYLRYVVLADGIDAEALLSDVTGLEAAAYARLAKTPEEKRLVAASTKMALSGKLLDFSLTNEEWRRYQEFGASNSPYDSFYKEAEIRDAAMANNVLAAMKNNAGAKVVVLVTGGFHSAGLDEHLRKAGVPVVQFTPRITKTDSPSGAAYLSVFAQEKTPLEKLFQGEKLFLATDGAASDAQLQGAAIVRAGAVATHSAAATGFSAQQTIDEITPLGSQVAVEEQTGKDAVEEIISTKGGQEVSRVSVSQQSGGTIQIVSRNDAPAKRHPGFNRKAATALLAAATVLTLTACGVPGINDVREIKITTNEIFLGLFALVIGIAILGGIVIPSIWLMWKWLFGKPNDIQKVKDFLRDYPQVRVMGPKVLITLIKRSRTAPDFEILHTWLKSIIGHYPYSTLGFDYSHDVKNNQFIMSILKVLEARGAIALLQTILGEFDSHLNQKETVSQYSHTEFYEWYSNPGFGSKEDVYVSVPNPDYASAEAEATYLREYILNIIARIENNQDRASTVHGGSWFKPLWWYKIAWIETPLSFIVPSAIAIANHAFGASFGVWHGLHLYWFAVPVIYAAFHVFFNRAMFRSTDMWAITAIKTVLVSIIAFFYGPLSAGPTWSIAHMHIPFLVTTILVDITVITLWHYYFQYYPERAALLVGDANYLRDAFKSHDVVRGNNASLYLVEVARPGNQATIEIAMGLFSKLGFSKWGDAAARALAISADKTNEPVVEKLLENLHDKKISLAIAEALQAMNVDMERVLERYIWLLRHAPVDYSYASAWEVGKFAPKGHQGIIQQLLSLLQKEERKSYDRKFVPEALGKLALSNDEQVIAALSGLVRDENELFGVREAAWKALKQLGALTEQLNLEFWTESISKLDYREVFKKVSTGAYDDYTYDEIFREEFDHYEDWAIYARIRAAEELGRINTPATRELLRQRLIEEEALEQKYRYGRNVIDAIEKALATAEAAAAADATHVATITPTPNMMPPDISQQSPPAGGSWFKPYWWWKIAWVETIISFAVPALIALANSSLGISFLVWNGVPIYWLLAPIVFAAGHYFNPIMYRSGTFIFLLVSKSLLATFLTMVPWLATIPHEYDEEHRVLGSLGYFQISYIHHKDFYDPWSLWTLGLIIGSVILILHARAQHHPRSQLTMGKRINDIDYVVQHLSNEYDEIRDDAMNFVEEKIGSGEIQPGDSRVINALMDLLGSKWTAVRRRAVRTLASQMAFFDPSAENLFQHIQAAMEEGSPDSHYFWLGYDIVDRFNHVQAIVRLVLRDEVSSISLRLSILSRLLNAIKKQQFIDGVPLTNIKDDGEYHDDGFGRGIVQYVYVQNPDFPDAKEKQERAVQLILDAIEQINNRKPASTKHPSLAGGSWKADSAYWFGNAWKETIKVFVLPAGIFLANFVFGTSLLVSHGISYYWLIAPAVFAAGHLANPAMFKSPNLWKLTGEKLTAAALLAVSTAAGQNLGTGLFIAALIGIGIIARQHFDLQRATPSPAMLENTPAAQAWWTVFTMYQLDKRNTAFFTPDNLERLSTTILPSLSQHVETIFGPNQGQALSTADQARMQDDLEFQTALREAKAVFFGKNADQARLEQLANQMLMLSRGPQNIAEVMTSAELMGSDAKLIFIPSGSRIDLRASLVGSANQIVVFASDDESTAMNAARQAQTLLAIQRGGTDLPQEIFWQASRDEIADGRIFLHRAEEALTAPREPLSQAKSLSVVAPQDSTIVADGVQTPLFRNAVFVILGALGAIKAYLKDIIDINGAAQRLVQSMA